MWDPSRGVSHSLPLALKGRSPVPLPDSCRITFLHWPGRTKCTQIESSATKTLGAHRIIIAGGWLRIRKPGCTLIPLSRDYAPGAGRILIAPFCKERCKESRGGNLAGCKEKGRAHFTAHMLPHWPTNFTAHTPGCRSWAKKKENPRATGCRKCGQRKRSRALARMLPRLGAKETQVHVDSPSQQPGAKKTLVHTLVQEMSLPPACRGCTFLRLLVPPTSRQGVHSMWEGCKATSRDFLGKAWAKTLGAHIPPLGVHQMGQTSAGFLVQSHHSAGGPWCILGAVGAGNDSPATRKPPRGTGCTFSPAFSRTVGKE